MIPAAALVPADRLYLEPIIAAAARDHGLPADLLLAQAWAESSWKIDAVSHKGAVGVLQLMPSAVDFVSKRLLDLDHQLDVLDPAANARMGARYMFRRALVAPLRMVSIPAGKEPGMAEQHGMQPEHHAHRPEREYYRRARERTEHALRRVDEMQQRMAANIERERELLRKAR